MTVVAVGSKGTVLGYATMEKKRRRHQRNSHDAGEGTCMPSTGKLDQCKTTHKRGMVSNRQQSSGFEMTPETSGRRDEQFVSIGAMPVHPISWQLVLNPLKSNMPCTHYTFPRTAYWT